MTISLSPKEMFLSSDEQVKAFNDMVYSRTLQSGLALALTQFIQKNPSADEIKGVNAFIPLFLNIGQKDETPVTPVYKSIASSLPPREQPPTTVKK